MGARRLLVVSALASVVWIRPGSAGAGPDENRAAAREAAMNGIDAFEAGRFAEAIDLCSRAEAIIHAPVHLLYIARAQARLGQLVKARETLIRIAREPLATDAPRAFVSAQKEAIEEEAALAGRVPTLRVRIVPPPAGEQVAVTLDGAPLPPVLVGTANPIDPGTHTVQLTSNGVQSKPIVVTVAEGSKEEVVLHRAASVPESGPEAPRATPLPGADAPRSTVLQGTGSTLKIGGFAALGLGAVGLAAGTLFVVQNRSDRDAANALCAGNQCPESKRSQINALDRSATSEATAAWIAYGAGVASLGTGVLLFVLNGASSTKPDATHQTSASPRLTPWLAPRSAGATVTF